ncbi:uncharacterized protein NPIL_214341 [Nephila pilipes]|uniref:Uncharacterized protein n=1 Tax=Nephila pilipes TaxID=299642 RepID=A0A8X6TEG1_NEPPI|nr:uncharacterized protein NPIL_214341 [Nephila pilipes]
MVNEKSCLYEKNSGEINLLIGADHAGELLTGNVKHLSGGLVAVHTLLGWTVRDTLGIDDSSEKRSKTETQEIALKHFRETVSRDNTGRYKLNLPWLGGHPSLHDNKEMIQKRLKNTVRSLKSTNRLNEYEEVFNQWEREGIIEQINQNNDISKDIGVHYLPHRAVFKDTSTTKVSPVFD